jgi:hypothetical protein
MRKIFTNWIACLVIVSVSVVFVPGCKNQDKDKFENEEFEENEEYDGPGKAIEFEIERTKDPATGRVPWEKLRIAIEQTEMSRHTTGLNRTAALSWSERGPNGDFFGPQGNQRPNNGQSSGRIRASMIDSTDPSHNTVWVGGIDGGLWKTTDITASIANWTLVNDFLSNLAVSAICQDPRPGFQNNMYFCTGESFSNADAVRGVGVFKSIDGGVTWNFLPSTSTFLSGTRIICDNLGNVYLGTRTTGLQRSIDGGASWTNITPSGVSANICDLEISTTGAAGRLHVAVGIGSASGYRYTDIPSTVTSGSGWTAATTPFTSFNERIELGINGSTLYALPCSNSSGTASINYQVNTIWKTTDGGANWLATTTQPAAGWASQQGWYSLSCGVNPANPLECIVGGLDCYKTPDGGATWTKISTWVGLVGQYVHADQHNIQWWDGGAKLMFNCDGGVHFSTNGGLTTSDRNKNLRIKQFYSVAIHPFQTNYFLGGAQDNGVHRLDHVGLDSSIEVYGGDGMFVAIDQNEPQFQFGSAFNNVYRRTTNNGVSWTTPIANTATGRFVNPWDYDNNANIIYACNAANQYLRWDNPQTGATTTVVNVTGFAGGNVSAVHASPYTANRVFFGTGVGGVFIVDNANTGNTATATAITPAGSSGFANCVVTGSSEQHLMATYTNYGVNNVWVSHDGGTSWAASDGNLPDMPVRWALFHPDSDTKAFIATETGVWETDLLNGASTVWTANTSFPNVRTDMIKVRASDRLIAAGTHGRGIWTAIIGSPGGFSFNAPATVTSSCPAPATMVGSLTATYSGVFANPITLSATAFPPGTNVTFGTNPLTPGSPTTTVNLNNANTLAPGTYTVTVQGVATGASTQTQNITFVVSPGAGPAISGQPGNQSICVGQNATFTVASPSATSIKWQESTDGGGSWTDVVNGGVYGGATTTTLTLTSVPLSFNNNRYRAVASVACGSTNSNAAILTVNASAAITSHPADATLCAGSTHTFHVLATGTGLTYQWYLSTDGGTIFNPIIDGGVYSGALTPDLTLTGITAGMNNNKYRVVVTGTGACPAPVTSNIATLTVITSVNVTGQPANQTVCAGNNASFTVSGSGTGIIYQWQVSTDGGGTWSNVTNGGVYGGATTATLTITGATVSMNGFRYRAQLTNSTCSTPGISNAAILTVNSLPAITVQPANSTVCLAGNTSFTSGATGTGVTFQWQVSTDGGTTWTNVSNGGIYSGATTTTLNLTGVTAVLNNNRYRMVASGTCPPPANSNAAILTVVNPVVVSGQPANAEVCSGSNAVFTVSGTSTETINYQWQVSTDGGGTWTTITGANSATLTITNAQVIMTGNRYRALLSNSSCTTPTISNAAILTVHQLPGVTLTASPLTSLLPGQTTTLTATPTASTGGTLSTAWLFNGVVPVPPITGNTYVVDITKVGTYQVRIDEAWPSGLFCSSLSQVVTINATTSNRLFIFPSPNDGRFTVSYINNGGATTKRAIAIFDSKGALAYNRLFDITGTYTLLPIDMRQASRGIYYVVVGDATGKKLADGKVHIR